MTSRAAHVQALEVARSVATALMAEGATAVVVAGSHVRGEAHRESDVDLYALGSGSAYRLERRDGFLLSLSYRTPEQVRDAFHSPAEVGSVIPGWREAIILADRDGIAPALKEEAAAWTWEVVGERRCDQHVAESITGLAEEVHKLVVSLERGDRWTATVQRSILALHLAPVLAVHLRLLYGTENRLWVLVAERVGSRWREVQGAALGDDRQSFLQNCRAALELYGLAAREVHALLSPVQRAVVSHACGIAGHPLPASG